MSDWEYLGEGRFADIRNKVRKRAGRVTLASDGVATITFEPPIIMSERPRLCRDDEAGEASAASKRRDIVPVRAIQRRGPRP
ncbi:MAG: hypothetical protein CL804_03455 [Citromicrobium sp.]|nr:hypothetical protein [Citromicrobium sp.]|tara:strand:- start:2000 stop:2245 length:246 start_codon:yes stop_codon:yes gene_type:complete